MCGWVHDAALSMALPEQDLELVKLLMFYGANPSHQGDNDDTALHFLAQTIISSEDETYYSIMKYLLEHGANPNLINQYGETPLMDSISVSQANGVESLSCMLLLNHPSIDVTIGREDDRYTPLHSACWNNLNNAVQILLDKGSF